MSVTSKTKKEKEVNLTPQESERVDDIICLYLGFHEAAETEHEIALRGKTTLGTMVDFKGEIPSSSGHYFDTICPRAAEIEKHQHNHRLKKQADYMVSQVPAKFRPFLTVWPRARRTQNKETGKFYTVKDMYELFGMKRTKYNQTTSKAKKILIAIDQQLNPHLYEERNRNARKLSWL